MEIESIGSGAGVTHTFVVAAIAFVRDDCVLAVRKRGTRRFMLPGGKLEPGESAADAARREIAEEIGVEVGELTLLGELTADAANEPGSLVSSTVYLAELTSEPRPEAEIDEIRWIPIDPPRAEADDELAPLLLHEVLPLLRLA